jgi:4'-phosphopantetheinyl transferase
VRRAIVTRGDGQVHIWSGSLRLPAFRLAALASALNLDERERLRATRSPVARRRFIASRGQLRLLLGLSLGISPRDVPIGQKLDGRPVLQPAAGRPTVRFSVSHAGDDVVYALTTGGAVGIDIERTRENLDWRGLAARFFSHNEMLHLGRPSDFYRLWTRKEAMAKAAGGSLVAWLGMDLASAVTPDWRLWSWSMPGGAVSVALRARNPPC